MSIKNSSIQILPELGGNVVPPGIKGNYVLPQRRGLGGTTFPLLEPIFQVVMSNYHWNKSMFSIVHEKGFIIF